MNLSLTIVLYVLALIAFVMGAIGFKWRKTEMVAVGLALWSLALVIGRLPSLSVGTIILILAFLAFAAAAWGWRYRKINLIAVGLALYMLSLIL
jgi:hypothetical protein